MVTVLEVNAVLEEIWRYFRLLFWRGCFHGILMVKRGSWWWF